MTRVLLNPPLRLLFPLVDLCLRALGGSFLALLWFLLPLEPIVVCQCCKSDRLYALSLLSCSLCVLYCSITWEGAFLFYTDRQVIGLSWNITHGVFCAAARLASFGMTSILFCGPVCESLEHLFFYCPLAHSVLSWLQSSPLAPSLICGRALFGFSSDELLFVTRSFLYILGVFY